MKFKKIHFIISIICWIFVASLIIGVGLFDNYEEREYSKFDYNNVTEEQIIETVSKYSSYKNNEEHYGDKTNVKGDYDFCDYAYYQGSTKSITGIATVQSTKAIDRKVKITVSSTLNSGEMKIAIVRNGELIEYVDINQTVVNNIWSFFFGYIPWSIPSCE